jgi:hypothetical protein
MASRPPLEAEERDTHRTKFRDDISPSFCAVTVTIPR